VLLAKLAILAKLDPLGIVLFVFHIVVIALLALGAGKRDLVSHGRTLFSLTGKLKKHLRFEAHLRF
jgi:hypothetical protein